MKIISILLISLLITSTCYAEKYVLYDKVNKQYVNDFQSEATESVLIKNATRTGRNADEFEIRTVTDDEFMNLEKEVNEPIRQEKQAEFKMKKLDEEFKRNALLEKLKITKDEATLLLKE